MTIISESGCNTTDMIPFGSWPREGLPEGYFHEPLKRDAVEFYDKNGFLVLPEALGSEEVDAITAEAVRICRNEEGKVKGVESAPLELLDDDLLRQILCIHFPHKISKVMKDALAHPAVVRALTAIIGPDVKCMQSMLFIKAAGKPGQAWHQDEDYIPTRDRSLTGAWIALDDATIENGCLWVIPGSHRPGILWEQQWHGDRRFDCASESQDFPYTAADEVPVEVKRGSVVFFNGYLLHRSLPNRAQSGYRRALVNHYMNARSFLPWRYDDSLSMAMQDYRDIVMVAGTDPYLRKGISENASAFVRPAGEGGCVSWNKEKKPLEYTKG